MTIALIVLVALIVGAALGIAGFLLWLSHHTPQKGEGE